MAADDRIDGYAAAILAVAKAEGRLEEVGDQLYQVARTFESSADLRDTLADPRVPVDRKRAVVEDLLADKASPLTSGLVTFIVAAGRAADLPAIADRLAEQAAGERDRVIAEVRSVAELDDEQVARLEESLSRATGKRVEVKTVLDPTLLGGIVARVGDVVIDGSVRHRIEQLRETLERP
jgi:F-type H+-transporting ATPase subunit delta